MADTLFAMSARDREMVQVAAPTVMAAEDGTDNFAVRIAGDGALAGIAIEKGCDGFAGVGIVQAHALSLLPEGVDGVVVGEVERAQGEFFHRDARRCW